MARRTAAVALISIAALAAGLTACHRSEDVTLPPTGTQWDYQIGGGYPLPDGATIVSRDRTDTPAAGAYNICYVNGFQTQPDETDWGLTSHPDLVLRTADGCPVLGTSVTLEVHGVRTTVRSDGFVIDPETVSEGDEITVEFGDLSTTVIY